MSDHEDILMGFDAISDRLNDADQLVRATRASYLDTAQRLSNVEKGHETTMLALNNAMDRLSKAKELAEYMRDNPDHFTTIDVRDHARLIYAVLDGA